MPVLAYLYLISAGTIGALAWLARRNQRSGWVKDRGITFSQLTMLTSQWEELDRIHAAAQHRSAGLAERPAARLTHSEIRAFTFQLAHLGQSLGRRAATPEISGQERATELARA